MAFAAPDANSGARGLPVEEVPSSRPDSGAPRPSLDVVDRRLRASSSTRRQAKVLKALGALFVVGAFGVTAAAHTFVASDQQRIDALQGQLGQALATQQELQVARAELESPSRVLAIAEHQLGMVSPGSVTYLSPVSPGPSVEQSGAKAARAASASGQRSKSGLPVGGIARRNTATSASSHPGGQSAAVSRAG
jgi:cell division protein FtsB